MNFDERLVLTPQTVTPRREVARSVGVDIGPWLGAGKTPDALHLTSALTSGCDIFLSNDRNLPEIDEISVVALSKNS